MSRYALAAVAAAALALVAYAAHALYAAGYETAETRYTAEIAKAQAEASEQARQAEQALAKANAAAAEQYERGKQDAQAAADRVVADLRGGTLRLRREWAGCEAKRVSETAASAAELDAAEQRREESAGRIVRAAAECDAQVAGLQQLIRGWQ